MFKNTFALGRAFLTGECEDFMGNGEEILGRTHAFYAVFLDLTTVLFLRSEALS